jgi:hypothetical protein
MVPRATRQPQPATRTAAQPVTGSYITGDLLPIIGAAVTPAVIMGVIVLLTNRRR